MTIFFYKRLTRNLEIPPSESCPVSGDCGELRITNVSNKMLLNAAMAFHEIPTDRGTLVQKRCFSNSSPCLMLTFQIIYQYPVNIKKIEHDTTFEIS